MKKLYTIRDVKAGYGVTLGVPAILDMPNDEYARRVLKGSCAKGQKANALNTYPEDKELWCIGEFDDLTGRISQILLSSYYEEHSFREYCEVIQ